MKRSISTKRYVLALVFTLLIFIPGLLLGIMLDNARAKTLEQESQLQEINFRSNQLSYAYITSLENNTASCVALKASLETSIKDLSKSLDTIENYKKDSKFNTEDFEILSRRYVLDNLNYWLLSKKTKELCGYDTVNVLYFFNSACENCPDQGIILTYFKKKMEDKLLVFPINTDIVDDEQMISLLVKVYNVTEYPSIVIDDSMHKGIVSTEEFQKILCEEYSLNETECSTLI